MKNRLYYKTLAVGIIVLFIGVSVSSAVDFNLNVDDGAIEKPVIETLDNNDEIITYIHGSGEEGSITIEESGWGIFHNVELWSDTSFQIKGLRRFFIIPMPFLEETRHIVAPRCLIFGPDHISPGQECVYAIALGNLEWS